MAYEMIPELQSYCKKQGIEFLSSAFSKDDFAAVDPHVKIHKIASYEISHMRLLELAARTQKPLLLSTGASEEEDIAWAVEYFRSINGGPLYIDAMHLKISDATRSCEFACPALAKKTICSTVGLSDHTRDPLCAPLGAVALGATVIEKHYTLNNLLPGPDHFFAITGDELKQMVKAIRMMEPMLGSGEKGVEPAKRRCITLGVAEYRLYATLQREICCAKM